jgi:hypothetical protein
MDPADYCRQVEAYLCGKNDGHLIRVVGPAFETVSGWAQQGIPLKIVFRGIDQYCARYYAKGGRRRPVRIEFCEADILDLFDAWRRAIGVTDGSAEEPAPRRPSLASHIERAIARLTAGRAGGRRSAAFDAWVSEAVRELDGLLTGARTARGEARVAIIERLASMDDELTRAAAGELGTDAAAALRAEAEGELASFGDRLAPDAKARATQAACDRLARESLALPSLRYD